MPTSLLGIHMNHPSPAVADNRKLSSRQFNLLVVGLLTVAVGQSFIFAILPPLGREVNLSVVQINSMIACSALVFSVASPSWGRLSDRVGRKPVIVAGLAGYALGNLIFALAFEAAFAGWVTGTGLFASLLMVRCLQSVMMSGTNPGSTAYTADHSAPQHRTRALARLGTASSVGMIIGPILAGALAGMGLLFPLYCATALAAIAAVVVWRYLPASISLASHGKTRRKLSVFDHRLRLYLFCSFGGFTGFAGIQQTLAFRIQDMLQLSGAETAQYTGLALMITALCTLAMQLTVAQRFQAPPLTLIRGGVLFLMAGPMLIAVPGSFTLVLLGMACLGTGLGLAVPAIAAAASLAVDPEEQGGAAGLITACPAAGFVIGPIVCGSLYEFDPTLSAIGAAVILLAVAITAFKPTS